MKTRIRTSSLRWRLPVLILALLAASGGAFAWTANREMRHALRQAADERVRNAAAQLADLLSQTAAARVAESRRLAADVAVHRFVVAGEDPDAALAALRVVGRRNPQATLWLSARGGTAAVRLTSENIVLERAPQESHGPTQEASEGVGPLRSGDGRVTYRTIAFIAPSPGEANDGAGFLSIDRPLSSSAGAALIERLIGSGAIFKFGNAAGDLWTDLSSPVQGPPATSSEAMTVSFADASRTRYLGTAAPIAGTPWRVWVQFNEASLMQPAATLLRRMLPWTAGLILLGVAAVWFVSARITAPLEQMADTADAIASGDYSHRVKVGTSHDETGRLALAFNTMAARVAESHDALEARVQARTQELSKSREELQQFAAELTASNRELEAFSYSVSHDLRAPLRSVDGFSQALLEDCGETLGPDGQEHLRRIRAAAQHMGQLIDDLLKLARVTRAELNFERIDLSAMAQSTLATLRDKHQDRDVEWQVQPGLQATGDARLLQIALTNLLENAWKFTGKRPQAQIEFGMRNGNGKPREYFVKDNGAGFDATYASKLFGAFQRLHHPGEFPGTGIGLATVQRIVTRHGGQIRAEGVPDQGATFTFTLHAEPLI
jgi:signal transduction histidine kinase